MDRVRVMSLKSCWAVVFFLFLLSCDKEEPTIDYLSPVGEVELPDEIALGQTVTMLVKHGGSNGCARYSRNETIEKDKEIEVTFYAKSDPPKGPCTFALITIETEYKFKPKDIGTYIFKFNQRNGYLVKNVVVR